MEEVKEFSIWTLYFSDCLLEDTWPLGFVVEDKVFWFPEENDFLNYSVGFYKLFATFWFWLLLHVKGTWRRWFISNSNKNIADFNWLQTIFMKASHFHLLEADLWVLCLNNVFTRFVCYNLLLWEYSKTNDCRNAAHLISFHQRMCRSESKWKTNVKCLQITPQHLFHSNFPKLSFTSTHTRTSTTWRSRGGVDGQS